MLFNMECLLHIPLKKGIPFFTFLEKGEHRSLPKPKAWGHPVFDKPKAWGHPIVNEPIIGHQYQNDKTLDNPEGTPRIRLPGGSQAGMTIGRYYYERN